MAIKKIIVCDICGGEVLGGEGNGVLYTTGRRESPPRYRIEVLYDNDIAPLNDICQNCADKIVEILDSRRQCIPIELSE